MWRVTYSEALHSLHVASGCLAGIFAGVVKFILLEKSAPFSLMPTVRKRRGTYFEALLLFPLACVT